MIFFESVLQLEKIYLKCLNFYHIILKPFRKSFDLAVWRFSKKKSNWAHSKKHSARDGFKFLLYFDANFVEKYISWHIFPIWALFFSKNLIEGEGLKTQILLRSRMGLLWLHLGHFIATSTDFSLVNIYLRIFFQFYAVFFAEEQIQSGQKFKMEKKIRISILIKL